MAKFISSITFIVRKKSIFNGKSAVTYFANSCSGKTLPESLPQKPKKEQLKTIKFNKL